MEVKLRKAEAKDASLLFQWRDETTIANSAQPRNITMEEHEAWFQTKLKDKSNHIHIGSFVTDEDGKSHPFGVIRFDHMKDGSEVSINIDPLLRGRGLGKKLLQEGIRIYPKHRLFATIRGHNVASLIIFLASGFELMEYNSRTGLTYLKREPS